VQSWPSFNARARSTEITGETLQLRQNKRCIQTHGLGRLTLNCCELMRFHPEILVTRLGARIRRVCKLCTIRVVFCGAYVPRAPHYVILLRSNTREHTEYSTRGYVGACRARCGLDSLLRLAVSQKSELSRVLVLGDRESHMSSLSHEWERQ
jgi:hypothetical protein